MKRIERACLAGRYANAFLDLHINSISEDDLGRLAKFKRFLKRNRVFYVCLRLPTIEFSKKEKILKDVFKLFSLPEYFEKLITVLLNSFRIELLDKIIDKIIIFYRQRKNISFFDVFTSHKISDFEREKIIKFIKSISTGKVVADFKVNEKLIAGFRIQSSILLWERSIAKQLRDVKRSVFKQVGIW